MLFNIKLKIVPEKFAGTRKTPYLCTVKFYLRHEDVSRDERHFLCPYILKSKTDCTGWGNG